MKKFYIIILPLFVLLLGACNEQKSPFQNVALLGDSMTWYGGDNFELDRGWTHHFKRDAQPLSLTSYARSGASWTNTDSTTIDTEFYTARLHDKNVIYNQVMRMVKAEAEHTAPTPDLIIMYAGGNDVSYSDHRPGIFDLTPDKVLAAGPYPDGTQPSQVTSLAGSVRLCCDIVCRAFPDARIVLVTPIEKATKTPEEVHRVDEIIEAVGHGLGLEVLRADRYVDIRHEVEKQQYTFTVDGVHTNPIGARLISDYLISALK